MRIKLLTLLFCFSILSGIAQNALNIPPALTGTNFSLNVQTGTSYFYKGTTTPTYGINGIWMSPTIIVNKGDSILLNVHNGLNTNTTMHWHGFHVAAKNDGGPDQIIVPGSTWSPSFKVRNDAGTYWYHPHGINRTEMQVSKGLAGMLIVKDSAESSLGLPSNYGKDDFPVIIQSKAFDVLTQIAIATEMDTALFVNGTLNPYLDAPAQVIRLRLLNAGSMRSYLIGLSNDSSFSMIAGDDGLLDSALPLKRIRISPGERAEILIDLKGMQGKTFFLKNYGSELPDGIYGAKNVGKNGDTIADYHINALNGADYKILQIKVVAPLANAFTTIPAALMKQSMPDTTQIDARRVFYLNADSPKSRAAGPFNINWHRYSMDSINMTTTINNTEIWTWINRTLIAHPIHVHDIHFYILDINGKLPPKSEQGKKDVVLVLPGDTVRFITKFEDFSDTARPYMYHCHLLHHEDDGMMGSFLVFPAKTSGIATENHDKNTIRIYPNPASKSLTIDLGNASFSRTKIRIYDAMGREYTTPEFNTTNGKISIGIENYTAGIYFLRINSDSINQSFKINISR